MAGAPEPGLSTFVYFYSSGDRLRSPNILGAPASNPSKTNAKTIDAAPVPTVVPKATARAIDNSCDIATDKNTAHHAHFSARRYGIQITAIASSA